jgi:hypothetical protein
MHVFNGINLLFIGNLIIQVGIANPTRPILPFLVGLLFALCGSVALSAEDKNEGTN